MLLTREPLVFDKCAIMRRLSSTTDSLMISVLLVLSAAGRQCPFVPLYVHICIFIIIVKKHVNEGYSMIIIGKSNGRIFRFQK